MKLFVKGKLVAVCAYPTALLSLHEVSLWGTPTDGLLRRKKWNQIYIYRFRGSSLFPLLTCIVLVSQATGSPWTGCKLQLLMIRETSQGVGTWPRCHQVTQEKYAFLSLLVLRATLIHSCCLPGIASYCGWTVWACSARLLSFVL